MWQSDVSEHDRVEARIGERERPAVAGDEVDRRIAGQLARPLDEQRRRIQPGHVRDTRERGQVAADRAGAAADLQQLALVGELQPPRVLLQHRPLPRVGRAQLEHLSQALLHGDVRFGDRRVDVRHGEPPVSPRRHSGTGVNSHLRQQEVAVAELVPAVTQRDGGGV
jgi:hypothetical protein